MGGKVHSFFVAPSPPQIHLRKLCVNKDIIFLISRHVFFTHILSQFSRVSVQIQRSSLRVVGEQVLSDVCMHHLAEENRPVTAEKEIYAEERNRICECLD